MDKVYLTAIAAADLQKNLVIQHSKKLDDVGLKFLTRPYFFTSILKSALGSINLLITEQRPLSIAIVIFERRVLTMITLTVLKTS